MKARVLLVSNEMSGVTSVIWDRLELDGFEVRWCPGPMGPGFVCAGGRGDYCALPCRSDVVVLDCWLDSDIARRGTPSWHLLGYYVDLGLPVVALIGPDGLRGTFPHDRVVTLPRDATPQEISIAVASLAFESAGAATR